MAMSQDLKEAMNKLSVQSSRIAIQAATFNSRVAADLAQLRRGEPLEPDGAPSARPSFTCTISPYDKQRLEATVRLAAKAVKEAWSPEERKTYESSLLKLLGYAHSEVGAAGDDQMTHEFRISEQTKEHAANVTRTGIELASSWNIEDDPWTEREKFVLKAVYALSHMLAALLHLETGEAFDGLHGEIAAFGTLANAEGGTAPVGGRVKESAVKHTATQG
ncbi:hypothetical protein LTR85_006458 [Meristemomyces frigidus]|nr:hypothetical protein LTR85_006458 [Meristemomyces frigidus]